MSKENGFFPVYDIPSAIYLFFSHLLVHMLKNYHYARNILDAPEIDSCMVFRSGKLYDFPDFSGNRYLNYFLEALSASRSIECEKIPIENEALNRAAARPPENVLHRFHIRTKKILGSLYSILVKPDKSRDVWVYGSLSHLKPLLKVLRKRGVRMVMYHDGLDLGQLRFAMTNGIPYVTPGSFAESARPNREDFVRRRMDEIEAAADHAIRQGLFYYDGFDFGPFVRNEILSTLGRQMNRFAVSEGNYDNLLADCGVSVLVTDEDYALRGGFLGVFARRRGIESICVSHANTAVDFAVPRESATFAQSTTCVNSEYEKSMYAARGWDPGHFAITGTPRYDFLSRNKSSRKQRERKRDKIRLLYCANTSPFDEHTPEKHGYLGRAICSFDIVTLPAALAVFQAIEDLPVELIVKPHNVSGLDDWTRLIAESNAGDKITLFRKPVSILELIRNCDAMVLSYWSTTLIESAICGIPTLFLDLKGLNSPSLRDYADRGFCKVIHREEELKAELKCLCDGKRLGTIPSAEELEYYLGPRDGKSSERVAEIVTSRIRAG